MKPGAESPVIYDFIRRYTIRPYLKVEVFFMPTVQATLNDRISMVFRCESTIVNTRYRRRVMNVSSAAKKGCPATSAVTYDRVVSINQSETSPQQQINRPPQCWFAIPEWLMADYNYADSLAAPSVLIVNSRDLRAFDGARSGRFSFPGRRWECIFTSSLRASSGEMSPWN